MACLFDYTQVIKHNYFIKTGERLQPVVVEAVAQAGVIWYSLTVVIPHSITHCSKSCGPLRVQWKRGTRERATLIKALLNLTISVRYRRAITPERLQLPFSCSYFPSPSSIWLYRFTLCILPLLHLLLTHPLPLLSHLFPSSFSAYLCEKNSPTFYHF